MTLYDDINEGKEFEIELPSEDMLIRGSQMDDERGDSVCYLPFLPYQSEWERQSWILGEIVMR